VWQPTLGSVRRAAYLPKYRQATGSADGQLAKIQSGLSDQIQFR
jgi:hypothetical protein